MILLYIQKYFKSRLLDLPKNSEGNSHKQPIREITKKSQWWLIRRDRTPIRRGRIADTTEPHTQLIVTLLKVSFQRRLKRLGQPSKRHCSKSNKEIHLLGQNISEREAIWLCGKTANIKIFS